LAERPAFFADNHFRGPVQKALRKWADVIRTVDLFGEKNDDEELLSHAAKGSGRSSTPRTTLKIAALEPIARARVATAPIVNADVRRRARTL
jgi:hypothetical protein